MVFGVVISFLCPPRPKTYSWTAAFVLCAPFAVGKAGVGAKQGLNHAKSRIREHGRGGCLSKAKLC